MQVEQLRAIIAKGPPPQPDGEHPGPLRSRLVHAIETCLPQLEQRTAEACVAMLAHVLDLMAWDQERQQFEQLAAALAQMEKRVVPVELVR